MAYIAGLLTPEEEKRLEARGWEIEDCPNEWIYLEDVPWWKLLWYWLFGIPNNIHRMRAVWVDNDMYSLMSGPDWEMECSECGQTDPGFEAHPGEDWHKEDCSYHPRNGGGDGR